MNPRPLLLATASIALLILTAGMAAADVVADFDDGNTAAAVDGYPGTAGDGWAGAWQEQTGGVSFTTGPTVVADTPLSPGGGNYLTATSTGNGQATVSRLYDGVDRSQPHTIQFQFRPDDLPDFTARDDRLFLFDRDAPREGTDASATWILNAAGAADANSNFLPGEWALFDGDKNGGGVGGGFYSDSFVNAGIPIVAGNTYDVTVSVRPADQEWDLTVADAFNSFTYTGLGFRANTTQTGGYLHFGARGTAASDDRTWSADSVRIAAGAADMGVEAIRADFTDGQDGTAGNSVDAFRGKAGRGWADGWSVRGNGNVDVTKNIDPPTQVVGPGDTGFAEVYPTAGRYLDVSMYHKDNNANGQAAFGRPYEDYGVVDTEQPHMIYFTMRIDEPMGGSSPFANADWDQYFVFDGTALSHGYSERNDASWLIVARGDYDTRVGNWQVYDGPGDDGPLDASRLVDTPFTLAEGTTYHFAVQVDPQNATYNVAMADAANGRVYTDLGFQKSGTGVGQFLTFGTRSNRPADNRQFSLDMIRIDAPVSEITADFNATDGNQYGARPGNGWVTPWLTTNGNIVPELGTENPLMPGSGNYLKATVLPGGGTSLARMYLGEFDITAPQQISWQYRHDSPMDEFADTDRIHFFEDARALSGSATSNRWLIFADGRFRGDVPPGYWILFDPSQSGDDRYIDTGIPLAEDHVYTFAVNMDPAAGLWDAVVRDETAKLMFTNDSPLGFRTSARTAGGYLNFGAVLNAGRTPIQFSLDSIRVSDQFLDFSIPEPSSFVLAALGLLGLAALVRRRRR